MPSNGPVIPCSARCSTGVWTKRTVAGQSFARAASSMPRDASTATMSASGATASRAAVEAPVPQPASSNRKPLPRVGIRIRRAVNSNCSW